MNNEPNLNIKAPKLQYASEGFAIVPKPKKEKMKKINKPVTIKHHIYLGDYAGCGYIRCIFPSMLLSQYGSKEQLKIVPSYNSNFVNDGFFYKDLLFVMFQRAATQNHLNIIEAIQKNVKIPLLYEIDDLLTEIPYWNSASDYYLKNKKFCIEIMKKVKGIIVSTNKLKEIYSEYNKNIIVNKNHLMKAFWNEPKWKNNHNKKPKILWAGSGNHFNKNKKEGGDFDCNLIDFILKTTDKYEWNIIGGLPLELKNKKIIYHNWINIFEYPNFLKSINADLAIAPLENNLFNQCKSNIKALEYTVSGIPGIYSDITPYKNMTLKAKSSEIMINLIETHINNKNKLKKIWKKDLKTIRNQLFWEENNNLFKYYSNILKLLNLKI